MNYRFLLSIFSLVSALQTHAMHHIKKSISEPLAYASSSGKIPYGTTPAWEEATHLFTVAFTYAFFIEKLASGERDTEYQNALKTLTDYAQRDDLEYTQYTILKQLQEATLDLDEEASNKHDSQRTQLCNDAFALASAYRTAKSSKVRKAAYLVIGDLIKQGHQNAISFTTDFVHTNHPQPLSDDTLDEVMPLILGLAQHHATTEPSRNDTLTRELLTFANHYSGHSDSNIRLCALRCINLFIGIHPYAKQCARNAIHCPETDSPSIKELLQTMQNKIKLATSTSAPL